jgi:hypothetical protein
MQSTDGVTATVPGTGGPVPTFKKIVCPNPQHPVAPPVTKQVYVMGVVTEATGFAMFGLLNPVVGNHAYVIGEVPQVVLICADNCTGAGGQIILGVAVKESVGTIGLPGVVNV